MFQAMREANSGVYCGPLRLLAMEVFDSVNQQVWRHLAQHATGLASPTPACIFSAATLLS